MASSAGSAMTCGRVGRTVEARDRDRLEAASRSIELVLRYAASVARWGEAHGWSADRIVWEARIEARERGLSLPRLREDPWQNDRHHDTQRRCVGVWEIYRSLGLERALRLVLHTDVGRHEVELAEERRHAKARGDELRVVCGCGVVIREGRLSPEGLASHGLCTACDSRQRALLGRPAR